MVLVCFPPSKPKTPTKVSVIISSIIYYVALFVTKAILMYHHHIRAKHAQHGGRSTHSTESGKSYGLYQDITNQNAIQINFHVS